MARFLVMSDLHIEFGDMQLPKSEEIGQFDAVLLAGDIMPWTNCVHWADRTAKHFGVPVVLIAGNHEFYARVHPDRTLDSTINACRQVASTMGGRVIFLDDEETTIADVRILGSTLWTDFCLFGSDDQPQAQRHAAHSMNDFMLCWGKPHVPLSTGETVKRHEKAKRWLSQRFLTTTSVKTIVMTHHLPSLESVAARFKRDALSPAFASNLDDLIKLSEASLWIHGHTHDSFDYILHKTRVVCNPRGYLGHKLNRQFNPKLIVEI